MPQVQRSLFHNSSSAMNASRPPKSKDRGPVSKEDTQTDFAAMNIFGNTPAPTTGIDACSYDGFALNSGLKVVGSGVLLVGGESFRWRPWIRTSGMEGSIDEDAHVNDAKRATSEGGKLLNAKGQFDVDDHVWGVLDVVWPNPGTFVERSSYFCCKTYTVTLDLLILGTGATIAPVSPATRKRLNDLGIRLEVQDTRNASSQFNLLATERGIQQVAAALVPIGWHEGK